MSIEMLELGLQFMGGLMGQSAQKRSLAQAQHQFNQQMDHSIRRRVEDAKRAGIHPLFALGASSGASPTITAQGDSNPMGNALNAMAQTLNSLETNRASARRDEAEAALLDSERKRIEQELANGSRGSDAVELREIDIASLPKPRNIHGQETGLLADYYTPELPRAQAGKPAREVGVRSPYVEYLRDDGSKGLAFGQSVPGAEEINMFWIPLQNWWHTSKKARDELRRRLGIKSLPDIRKSPEMAKALARKAKITGVLRDLNRTLSQPHRGSWPRN